MQIKIRQTSRIEKETGLTCLDDCIATLAGYYHCDYEMMYADGYEMMGTGGEYYFASSYHIRLVNRLHHLSLYHGMKFHEKDYFSKRKRIKAIRREIQSGNPVLVLFDPFWCPWDWGFQQYSNEEGHCFLICDVTDKGFVCVDPYFEKTAEELPFEFFDKGKRGIYFVEYKEEKKVLPEEYIRVLHNCFSLCEKQHYWKTIYLLLDDLSYRDDIFNEVPSDELFWRSPLVGILLRINQSIQGYSTFVRYVARKLENQELMEWGDKIWNLAIAWKQSRKLIIKLYFIKRQDECLKEKTIQKMQHIIRELQAVPNQLHILLDEPLDKGEGLERERTKAQEQSENEAGVRVTDQKELVYGRKKERPREREAFICLDVTEWMNNKAFIYEKDVSKPEWQSDFSSMGHCYVVSEENPKDIWKVGEIPYVMKAIYDSKKDNIVCDGQTIPLPPGGYTTLCLIGSAEFGCSTEVLKVMTGDGREYEMEFYMTDYIYEPYYGEQVAWQGRGVYKLPDGYERMPETLYLYSRKYRFPAENITSVKLPLNPSIHIFGITLEKECMER